MENNEKELEERELKELELMNENENREFYVYLHIRLDNNTPFYVGKGTKNRAYYPYRNLHHDNICDACGYKVVKIKENLTESQAYRLENKMIKYYVHTLGYGIDIEGYDNYDHALPHLTNMDWGGIGGASGIHRSEESKRKNSESHKGKHHSKEAKQRIGEASKGRKQSKETRRKRSESLKGKNKGKHHSKEVKQKMSENSSGEKNPMWGKPSPNRIKVICITTGKIFDCIKDASNYYKCSGISNCCEGTYKSAGKLNGVKLQWKYVKNYNNEFKGILINPIIK